MHGIDHYVSCCCAVIHPGQERAPVTAEIRSDVTSKVSLVPPGLCLYLCVVAGAMTRLDTILGTDCPSIIGVLISIGYVTSAT